MLMICSSRARNRSLEPVVSCCFGRIASSDAKTESRLPIRGNLQKRNCKLLWHQRPKPCNLKTACEPKSDSCSTAYKLFTADYVEGSFCHGVRQPYRFLATAAASGSTSSR